MVEHFYKVELPMAHPSLPWLVGYAAQLLNRFRKGVDGKTAYERLKGKPYRKQLSSIAEVVMCTPLARERGAMNKLEERMFKGMYAGLIDKSDELVPLTREGALKCRAVKRLLPDDRYDKKFLMEVKGTPCEPVPGRKPEVVPLKIVDLPKEERLPPVLPPGIPITKTYKDHKG